MANYFLSASRWAAKPLRPYITDVTGNVRPMSAPNANTLSFGMPAYLKYTTLDYPGFAKSLVSKMQKLEDEQKSLVLAKTQPIETFPLLSFSPYLPPYPVLMSESDVVREANVELVNWVALALEQATGSKIRVLSETQKEKARPDMVWFYVLPGKAAEDFQNWKPFAVLEFKNTKMIDIAGFEPAIFNEKQGRTEKEFYQLALQGANNTLIKGDNAVWLTKQMTKYAKTTGVPYQVAFDYSTMLMLDFDWDLVKDSKTSPKSVQVAWLKEESKDGTDSKTHRSFLLGYLYNALQETSKREGIILK